VGTAVDAPAGRSGTRSRLAEAGLRLFAERGFDAVSVGDIEREVGLVPRRGALYRHFKSKEALLESAVQAHLESVAATRVRLAEAPADAASMRDLGTWILEEMDRQRLITHVLERDGARLEALRNRFRAEISDASYTALREILLGWGLGRSSEPDSAALAVLLLGSLVNARRSTWTLGRPPLEVDDERLATAWADLCTALLGSPSGSEMR
jgi:AcrR family transcriptional regulator